MWLKKLFLRLKRWYNQEELVDETKDLSPRLRALKSLELLNVRSFKTYRASVGSAFFITPYYTNIDLYTDKIREALINIQFERAIKPKWVPSETTRVNVDNFLITKEGFYLDHAKAVERFRDSAVMLCNALSKSDDVEYGVHEHNLRMMTKLIDDIRKISEAFNAVSLMN